MAAKSETSDISEMRKKVQEAFLELKEELKESCIVLDDIAAEVINWTVGFELLVQLTNFPLSIYTISSFADDNSSNHSFMDSCNKIVFFLGDFVYAYEETIKRILSLYPFKECIIYCSLSELSHTLHPNFKKLQFLAIKPFGAFTTEFSKIMEKTWKSKAKESRGLSPIVVISHFPALSFSLLVNGIFVLNNSYDTFPNTKVLSESPRSGDENNFPETPLPLLRLIHTLKNFLSFFNMKEDLYVLGDTSKFIANQLVNVGKAIQSANASVSNMSDYESPKTVVSLILIDRTLDLVSPMLHSDNLIDRIENVLSGSNGSHYTMDRRIDMSIISKDSKMVNPDSINLKVMEDNIPQNIVNLSGNLAHPNDKLVAGLVESLLLKKEKEALNEVRKKIVDVMTKEKIPFAMPKMGSVNIKQLVSLIEVLYKENQFQFYKLNNFLQINVGVVQALQSSSNSKWDELSVIEKILLLSVEDKSQSLLSRIIELMSQSNSDGNFREISVIDGLGTPSFTIKDIICLSIMIFSLVGDGSTAFEKRELDLFRELLLKRIIDLVDTPQSLEGWLGMELLNRLQALNSRTDKSSEEYQYDKKRLVLEVEDRVSDLISYLKDLENLRSSMVEYKSLMKTGRMGSTYIPLVAQIVNNIFDPKQTELRDLEQISSNTGVGSYLRSFSILSLKAKPKPSDNSVVIIFVVGGITANEIREIRDSFKQKTVLLIGSTSLATSTLMYQLSLNVK